ncbi:MAG TPA: polymer-forming cytoskeletal protein [Candidatus Omnitrophota bacterium]|nr:polymer-forming cytoskeletal protein [Candidatus Omnitrophota bacterium]
MRRREREELKTVLQTEEKFLDISAAMQGTLRFDDPVNIKINGKFEGSLNAKGKLVIGSQAVVKADINGEVIEIAGTVTGNIRAEKVVRVDATAKIEGDIVSPAFSAQEGAIINGRLKMESVAILNNLAELMTVYQVARYLEVNMEKINEWAATGILPAMNDNGEWIFDKNKVDEWVTQGKVR